MRAIYKVQIRSTSVYHFRGFDFVHRNWGNPETLEGEVGAWRKTPWRQKASHGADLNDPNKTYFLFFNFKIYFITFTALLGNKWHTSLYKFKAYTTTVLIDMYWEMITTVGSVNIHLLIHHFLISWIMLWVLHKTLEDSHISSWVMFILMPLNKIGTVTLFFFTFFFIGV